MNRYQASTLALTVAVARNGNHRPVERDVAPRPAERLPLGQVIVALQKLKRKYAELDANREAFRASVIHQKAGAFEGYKIVAVREVEVKAHTRKAHKRLLLAK